MLLLILRHQRKELFGSEFERKKHTAKNRFSIPSQVHNITCLCCSYSKAPVAADSPGWCTCPSFTLMLTDPVLSHQSICYLTFTFFLECKTHFLCVHMLSYCVRQCPALIANFYFFSPQIHWIWCSLTSLCDGQTTRPGCIPCLGITVTIFTANVIFYHYTVLTDHKHSLMDHILRKPCARQIKLNYKKIHRSSEQLSSLRAGCETTTNT